VLPPQHGNGSGEDQFVDAPEAPPDLDAGDAELPGVPDDNDDDQAVHAT
jgi:hypothetical protein